MARLSFCLLAAAAFAQPSETPTLWAQNMPRGAAAADSHLQRMIHFNAQYYGVFWHTLAPPTVTET